MNATVTPKAVVSLKDLEDTAKEAAEQLSKVNIRNVIWDKALKSLKPGLADLGTVRSEAQKEAGAAQTLVDARKDSYDSDAAEFVRTTRTNVDKVIDQLRAAMQNAETKMNAARQRVAKAQEESDTSGADFEEAQKKLLGLPKEIKDLQRQLAVLQTEIKEAHGAHQLVETIVKLEDLRQKLRSIGSGSVIDQDHEKALWEDLDKKVNDLIQKKDALPIEQASASQADDEYKRARTAYEDALKNRLNDIKQQVADRPGKS